MKVNNDVIKGLLQNYDIQPTGYSENQTITYGVLTQKYLYQKLDYPNPMDTKRYPQKDTDPLYKQDVEDWTNKYGKNFSETTPDQMKMVRKAFEAWEKVLNVHFLYVDGDNAQIRIGTGDTSTVASSTGKPPSAGYEIRPPQGNKGDPLKDYNLIVIGKSTDEKGDGSGWSPGTSGFSTLMHEIGHALGLDHPGDYSKNAEVYAGQEDNTLDTIMSYRSERPYTDNQPGYGSVLQSEYAASRMLTPARYDILALQKRLGVNKATIGNNNRFGDFQYYHEEGGKSYEQEYLTIFDAAGRGDYIDASNQAEWGAFINLEPGSASAIGGPYKNIVIAFNSWIENAIGGDRSDVLYGNELDNILDGRAANPKGSETFSFLNQ